MAPHMKQNLPFKIGEEIEVRSFMRGYRGGWFRCKIQDIKMKRGHVEEYCVEHCDFPEEELTWTKPYVTPRKDLWFKTELMVRPPFPSFLKVSELAEQDPATDIKAVVADAWRVGDSVDLWYEDVYWSGKITRFLNDGLVEVELPKPPIGEGGLYSGSIMNLRPTLHWSPKTGWTVPISTVNGESWYTARMINTRDSEWVSKANDLKEEILSCSNATSGAPAEPSNSELSPLINTKKPGSERVSKANDLKTNNGVKKETPSCSNATTSNAPVEPSKSNTEASGSMSSSDSEFLQFTRKNANKKAKHGIVLSDDDDISKDEKKNDDIGNNKNDNGRNDNDLKDGDDFVGRICSSNSSKAYVRQRDPIDSSIMELEELANKLRWMKGALEFGVRWSKDVKPSWKFLTKK
ncbi:hypothetical protein LUZ60_011396 [Juncus effusus]|nr:hypothetical protein LUZ60_011396 [Juncus effusus]